ncbi:hypothetical protein [Kitasatospora sp. NPDC056531]
MSVATAGRSGFALLTALAVAALPRTTITTSERTTRIKEFTP